MPKLPLINVVFLFFMSATVSAQKADSTLDKLQEIPTKYITDIDRKIDKYASRVSSKTEKTLTKLSRWENKIRNLLQRTNPQAAEKLFSNNQLTFTYMLQKFEAGEAIESKYQAQYDSYRDKLTTDLKYLQVQKANVNNKLVKPLEKAGKKMQQLNNEEEQAAVLQEMIKERKKQLINESIQYIGKSKYLTKINEESFYYIETLKNYKEIFNEPTKAESLAKDLLNKIPAFQQFVQKNSMLAALFGTPQDYGNTASLAGLQTRASVQSMIQDQIASGGPNAMQEVQQNIQTAQAELTKLKDKLLSPMKGNGGGELPDFKIKEVKSKTFKQRLQYGANFQSVKSNTLLPATTDIGLSIGYKINDNSVAGIGASYKIGLGSINHIRFSNQGASLRSFMDWKLKKQFFISGGMEMNYLTALPTGGLRLTSAGTAWQQSALAGISKKVSIKTKWFKETKIQLLYDFLSRRHLPVSQPVVFRLGYNF